MSSAPQSSSLPSSSTTAATPSYAAQTTSSFHVFQAASPSSTFSHTASVSEAPTPVPAPLPETSADVNGTASSSSNTYHAPEIPATVNVQAVAEEVWRRGKHKGRRAEEVEAMAQTATRIAMRLAEDHAAVLHPDVDTPFADAKDVVRRLLPYHVYQHPLDDLLRLAHPSGKGKDKATEEDLLREEVAETKFALQCWKRKVALEKRLRAARVQSGTRNAPDDQAYVLAHLVLEADRAETAALNAEYRSARSELDAAERKRKLQLIQQVGRTSGSSPAPVVPSGTTPTTSRAPNRSTSVSSVSTPQYSTYSAASPIATVPAYATTGSTPAPTYSAAGSTYTSAAPSPTTPYSQYRYTYPYAQTYGTAYSYSPYTSTYSATAQAYLPQSSQPPTPAQQYPDAQTLTQAPSSLAAGTSGTTTTQAPAPDSGQAPNTVETPAQATSSSATVPAVSAAASTPTTAATAPTATPVINNTGYTPASTVPTGPIPLVLPASALSTLSGIGVVPVPAANAPPAGQPQPAAVIKGTTQNGTMVSLEINISALQATQAGALAVLLSALTTARSTNAPTNEGVAATTTNVATNGSAAATTSSPLVTPVDTSTLASADTEAGAGEG